MQRATGYRAALQEAGLYDHSLELLWPRPRRWRWAPNCWTPRCGWNRPDALFFCNDDIAQGALLEALRRGCRYRSASPSPASMTYQAATRWCRR
jgi:LacI family gluconate utilization system Gnt-I transcriptional repressor